MPSSLFGLLSFLRPADADLSEREKWLVQLYRLLSLIAVGLIPAFGVLYRLWTPAVVDPWWARFTVMGLFAGLFGTSYVSTWVRTRYTPFMWGCLYVLVAWVTALAILNQVAGDYAVASLFVFCVAGVCIGIGIERIGPLGWFLGYGLVLSAGIYVVVSSPTTSPFALVGCTATLAIVLYFVFQARVSMRRRLRAAREEAQTASRLKSALLANMSHEVRTPLTSILGFAEMIADADPDNTEALASSIRRSGRRLLDTLDSVLRVSRLEAGEVDLQPESLDVTEVVADRVGAFESMAERNDVQLECDRGRETVKVQLDPEATKRIVGELVQNAIEFSESGDRARVAVQGHSEAVTITVEDTGVGMSEEHLKDLFRPFEQESVGRDRTHEGTGLGLTVTHRLAQLMDGSIDIESEEGAGTRVTVTLPRRKSTATDE